MDMLNVYGLYFIEYIQRRLVGLGGVFTFLSNVVGNPSALYTIYFPAIYGFDCDLGVKLATAAAFGDWCNMVMKWLFLGHRPYWWVKDMNLADSIHIKQFPNTCETGPGTPSGHVAITGLVWFVLSKAIIEKLRRRYQLNLDKTVWSIYGIMIGLLGLSRMYIAAHFPHQCLFGLGMAITLGKFISDINFESMKLHHYLIAAFVGMASFLSVDMGWKVLGVDVNWTVYYARKYCQNPEWVHISTSSLYVMSRCTGILIGTGFLINSAAYQKLRRLNNSLSLAMKTTISICCLCLMSVLTSFTPITIYYPSSYLLVLIFHAVLVYIVGVGVPECLIRLGLI